MKEKVLNTIIKNSLILSKDKIVIGVSGGPDSMALLNILLEIKKTMDFEIVVAHINHMIRIEAIEEEEYVRNFCKKNDIEFYAKKVDVVKLAKEQKKGVEETARNIRYDFFEEICKKTNSNKVAIAHNKNDNVETVLMNLFRGSSVNGLRGIEPKRQNIIRPIIECERKEIEEYCEKEKLYPKIDKTNLENDYTRNKIRNSLLPFIKQEFNPNIIETIDRLSILVRQQEEYINKQVELIYTKVLVNEQNSEIILSLKEFNNQEKVIKSKLIIYIVTNLFGTAVGTQKVHIEDIIKMCDKAEGNKYLTPNKHFKVLVKDKKIYFIKV